MNKFDSIQKLLGLSEKEKSQILSINLSNHPKRKYKRGMDWPWRFTFGCICNRSKSRKYYTYTTEESEKLELLQLTEKLDGNIN